jgi:hypothetical protein
MILTVWKNCHYFLCGLNVGLRMTVYFIFISYSNGLLSLDSYSGLDAEDFRVVLLDLDWIPGTFKKLLYPTFNRIISRDPLGRFGRE